MAAKVYFIDLRATFKKNLFARLDELLHAAGLDRVVKPRSLVAVKLHFGEHGNTAFIRPVFIRQIVKAIKSSGGEPFLTDTGTLYHGARCHAPAHINSAIKNGFAPSVVDAPIVIADGLRGKSDVAVTIDRKRFREVFIGAEIARADALVSVAHFKGHELAGFGGALKNVGMGCASRRGKMAQHSEVCPKIKAKRCIGCGDCAEHCAYGAITLTDQKAIIDDHRCSGCGECVAVCPNDAVKIRWNQAIPVFMENMAEYALGVMKGKAGKALLINVITDVSPDCDCMPYNDAPIVRDIGFVASRDPVAIDQASADLVNAESAIPGSCLETHMAAGEDKFKGIYPKVDWRHQLIYAESLGLGKRQYQLEVL